MKIGIDIGSVTTKGVLVRDKKIIASALTRTGAESEKSAEFIFAEILKQAGIKEPDVESIVGTGYGRRIFKKAGRVVTEISAAGYGAYFLAGGNNCLVVDVGGQDTKVIEVNQTGGVTDFLMNDKCAAGTGRFIEMMAGVLEADLETMSEIALKAGNPVTINATCSVFAESEVVSLIAGGARKEDIAAGLFNAISTRIAAMLRQFEADAPVLFCGGGAKSKALKVFLEKSSGRKISVLENPQFVVALGATLA